MAERCLDGLRVLVTRPAAQAGGLVERLAAAGASVLLFPVMAIAAPSRPGEAERRLRQIDAYQGLVFVSANAVTGALALRPPPWPAVPTLAAVGKATATTLVQAGFTGIVHPPQRFDSEGLLELEPFQRPAVAGRRLLIIRGEGGREMLADSLRQRGARVDYAEVYRRARAATDPAPLREALEQGALDVVTVTSVEALHYLLDLAGDAYLERLFAMPFLVVSERVGAAALAAGCHQPPLVADQPGDAGLLQALRRWRGCGEGGE